MQRGLLLLEPVGLINDVIRCTSSDANILISWSCSLCFIPARKEICLVTPRRVIKNGKRDIEFLLWS